MMLDIKNELIALAAGILLGGILAALGTYRYEEATWKELIAIQKVEAAKMLQEETEKAIATERKNEELNNKVEKTHAEAQDTIDRTLADNRRLARQLRGLRDPGRRQDCSGTESGNSLAANPAASAAGSQLSSEASEFLLEFAADADRVAEYALTCHAWVQEMAAVHNKK